MTKFVNLKLVRTFFLFFLAILFTLCTDEPTSIGENLIPDKDKLFVDTLNSYNNNFNQTFSTFQKDTLYYGTSSRVLLGNYNNLSIEMLLGFGIILPDSIKKQLDSNKVSLTSSWIEMKPNYWIGDSTQFSFSVFKINEDWTSRKFNNDTLAAIKATMTSISHTSTFTDSIITLQIDQSTVNEWVMSIVDSTLPDNNGLLFSPVSNTGIVGFQALAAFPISDYIKLKMVFEKQGSIDTISASPNIDIHSVTSTLPIDPPGSSILQSSSSIRGNLWFDISQVPENVIINKATLDLFIDEASTIQGSIKTDTVAISYYEKENNQLKINTKYGVVGLLAKDKSYSGDIRNFVQRWNNGDPNEGIQVVLSDEDRTASTIAFYNSSSLIDSLKPRLTIYYTKQ